MHQSWIGRITANPAPYFFEKPFLAGENVEWIGIEAYFRKPEQHYMHFLLNNKEKINNFGGLLAPLNIKYIILLKEADYENYEFLYEQRDLKIAFENERIVIFKNQNILARVYLVKNVNKMDDWSQILGIVSAKNLLDSVYLAGDVNEVEFSGESFKPLSYATISPLDVEVNVSDSSGYLVFTEPFDEGWTVNGEKPLANLGLTNAFRIEHSGTVRIHYQKFYVLLPSYIFSVIIFIGCILFLAWRRPL